MNKKEKFLSFFCIIISSPILSDISQNNTDMLEQQYLEIQRRHKEEKQLQTQLKEAAEVYHIKQVAQKAEKWRLIEKEKK